MITVDENFFDELLLKDIKYEVSYKEDKENQEKNDLQELIEYILLLQLLEYVKKINNTEYTEALSHPSFLDTAHSQSDRILTQYYPNLRDHILQVFDNGKKVSSELIDRPIFEGVVDKRSRTFLSNFLTEMVRNVSNDLDMTIREIIQEGIRENHSLKIISDNIKNNGLDDMRTRDGRKIPAEVRARMIAYTELSRAFNQAVWNTYASYGVELVNWVSVNHKNRCEDCLLMDINNPYPLNSFSPPPLHPYCCCTFEPTNYDTIFDTGVELLMFLDFTSDKLIKLE